VVVLGAFLGVELLLAGFVEDALARFAAALTLGFADDVFEAGGGKTEIWASSFSDFFVVGITEMFVWILQPQSSYPQTRSMQSLVGSSFKSGHGRGRGMHLWSGQLQSDPLM
jgi:hypothetical protein